MKVIVLVLNRGTCIILSDNNANYTCVRRVTLTQVDQPTHPDVG
jgi:hypothetical protein